MNDRLTVVEEKLAYIEKTLSDLDEVVRRVSRNVDGLRRQWQEIRDAATPIDPSRSPLDDVPPHYGPPTSTNR